MEPVVDFGLFELAAAATLSWLARRVYSRRSLAIAFLAASVFAPTILVFISHARVSRWVAVICLATAAVNAALLFPLVWKKRLGVIFAA